MQVGLIGSGNMARAMARGWGDPVLCSDSGSGRAQALADELGGRAATNAEVAAESDLVILCHKPYQLQRVAQEVAGQVTAVVSVLGGVPSGDLRSAYPDAQVFRMVPNTPAEVRQGVSIYAPTPSSDGYSVDAARERDVIALFERLGTVLTMDESLLGVALGVSSVGPAYQALLLEAQVDVAVRHGIKPAVAARLVAETMSGTAELLRRRDYDTLAVRREVTSPGGSTARGLDALERGGIRAAFSDAMNRVLQVAN
ncbi:MAG TPA: pyrroline-5-carboxylate reductase [Solirubrobacteraceae bacterium]|nr:pyrroline-5-carboxylate reductase [Solirubrobacteraceae bacterium]